MYASLTASNNHAWQCLIDLSLLMRSFSYCWRFSTHRGLQSQFFQLSKHCTCNLWIGSSAFGTNSRMSNLSENSSERLREQWLLRARGKVASKLLKRIATELSVDSSHRLKITGAGATFRSQTVRAFFSIFTPRFSRSSLSNPTFQVAKKAHQSEQAKRALSSATEDVLSSFRSLQEALPRYSTSGVKFSPLDFPSFPLSPPSTSTLLSFFHNQRRHEYHRLLCR